MLPETDTEAEIDNQENVLVWTNSVSKPIPEFENKRRRPPEKHPLLKLLEEENDIKHCDYTAHLLIQRQAREYAFAVEDVLRVLKEATDCIIGCEVTWRNEHSKKVPTTRRTLNSKHRAELELTEIGRKIITISEAVKRLQEEDALAFWTSQQRVTVLQLLVSFSKEAVKFRRKLARIKGSLEDRVRNVRRVAIQCECEITGNIVPSEIYYQWVKEDSVLYKDSKCVTANVSLQNLPKGQQTKMSSAMKKTVKNWMPCINLEGSKDSLMETDTESSLTSLSATANLSNIGKVYQISKKVEVLHKVSDASGPEDDSVCELALENKASTLSNLVTSMEENDVAPKLEDAWVPNPSQKHLETIASNVAPPQKFKTREYIYDHCESRIKEVSDGACLKYTMEDEMNNQNNIVNESSNCNTLANKTESEIPVQMAVQPINANTSSNHSSSSSGTSTLPPATAKLFSDSMEQQISLIVNARNAMHEIVTQTMNSIRRMEREWVSPETMVKSKASGKEFYQLVDFIVETARLTEDPAFASRLYPEDKHEIVSVLDPVLRELTNCFMSLHTLHNLVAVDVQYLKELVTRFPKGSLIIRDWVSDPSIDEELAEVEQPTAIADFDFDVDELFD